MAAVRRGDGRARHDGGGSGRGGAQRGAPPHGVSRDPRDPIHAGGTRPCPWPVHPELVIASTVHACTVDVFVQYSASLVYYVRPLMAGTPRPAAVAGRRYYDGRVRRPRKTGERTCHRHPCAGGARQRAATGGPRGRGGGRLAHSCFRRRQCRGRRTEATAVASVPRRCRRSATGRWCGKGSTAWEACPLLLLCSPFPPFGDGTQLGDQGEDGMSRVARLCFSIARKALQKELRAYRGRCGAVWRRPRPPDPPRAWPRGGPVDLHPPPGAQRPSGWACPPHDEPVARRGRADHFPRPFFFLSRSGRRGTLSAWLAQPWPPRRRRLGWAAPRPNPPPPAAAHWWGPVVRASRRRAAASAPAEVGR